MSVLSQEPIYQLLSGIKKNTRYEFIQQACTGYTVEASRNLAKWLWIKHSLN